MSERALRWSVFGAFCISVPMLIVVGVGVAAPFVAVLVFAALNVATLPRAAILILAEGAAQAAILYGIAWCVARITRRASSRLRVSVAAGFGVCALVATLCPVCGVANGSESESLSLWSLMSGIFA